MGPPFGEMLRVEPEAVRMRMLALGDDAMRGGRLPPAGPEPRGRRL